MAKLAEVIDVRTGGWGLSYADTTPYTETTVTGILFLSTNLMFFWAGYSLYLSGNYLLAVSIIISGIASFYYHYSQVHYGPYRDEVRLPLLIDYITAFITINLTFFDTILLIYKISNNINCDLTFTPIILGSVSIFCLFGSWIFEYGFPYIILHGFWHIFSALSAASLGTQIMKSLCG